MKAYCHLLFMLLLFSNASWGNIEVPDEQTAAFSFVEDSIRKSSFTFNRQTYQKIKDDKKFNYEDDPVLKKSILTDIQLWLMDKLSGLMRFRSGGWFDVLMLIGFTALFLSAVVILFRSNPGGIFYSDANNSKMITWQEDFNRNSFYETELANAISAGNWRYAIRYLYLITLQKFAENGIIHFKPEKSPQDYQRELDNHLYADIFNRLVYLYTYVWYGNFKIDSEGFKTLHELLHSIHFKDAQR